MTLKKDYIAALVMVIGIVAIDQISKIGVDRYMNVGGRSLRLIPNFLYFTLHYNDGAAWGVLPGAMLFFVIVTVVALLLFIFLAKDLNFRHRMILSFGLVLLIAGATGNFIDRLRLGYVIDFIDFYIFGYDFPIFNVADMALTIGMIFFGFDVLFLEQKRKVK